MDYLHLAGFLSILSIVAVQGFGWQKTTASVGAAIIAALNTNTNTNTYNLDAYYDGEIQTSIRSNEDDGINPMTIATPLAIASLGGAVLLSRPDDSKEEIRRIAFNEERQDRTFIFEAIEEGLTDEAYRKKYHGDIPEYLLSGLLAGMYYLPEERILKGSSDFGRKYTYSSYRKLEPIWKEFPTPSDHDQSSTNGSQPLVTFEYQAFADIPRLTYTKDSILVSSFRIFKFKIPSSIASAMNRGLTTSIIADAEQCLGIAVSNAGGYHSTKDYFRKTDRDRDQEQSITGSPSLTPDPGSSPSISHVAALAAYADEAARLAEYIDHAQSLPQTNDIPTTTSTASPPSNNNNNNNHHRLRAMASSTESDEGWVNINENGHWNRLHTHVGALWSGVYYIQSNPHTLLRGYSGALLLKPTSHVSEAVPLSDLALARMSCRPATPLTRNGLDGSVCDYIAIKPEPGMMVCFPAWLHHAVCPLSVKPLYLQNDEGLRISMAFNAVEKG